MPNSVTKIDLPDSSGLHGRREQNDFLDCYVVRSDMLPRKAADIITDFPKWAQFLLLIRRAITAPFGLHNDAPDARETIGIFPIESESPTEVIAGFDDKHLNFRVSVLSENGRVSLATWVAPHNWGGRLYLAAIMPFHIAIARNALRRVQRAS